MVFPVEVLPQALAALLLAALVVVLLRIGGDRPENRALALFFGATCAFNVAEFMYAVRSGTLAGERWRLLAGAVGLIDAILLVRFAEAYQRRASPPPWREALYLGGALALAIASFSIGFAGGRRAVADSPLASLDALLDMAWVIIPALLVRHAIKAPDADPWRSELLLASALAIVFAAIDGATPALTGLALEFARTPVDLVSVATSGARAILLAALCVQMVHAGARAPTKRRALAMSALAIAAVMTASNLVTLLRLADWPLAGRGGDLFFATVFLAEPLIVSYALLRHQLLDIDLKVKIGLSRGALAAIFLAVFFVVTQVAQNFLQGYGVLAGGIAAGIMLFAITPLQRVAERFADSAMPGVGGRRDPTSREIAYKHALRFALSEGGVTREEELQLAHLADELGLSTQIATRLRHEVEEAQGRM